MADFNISSEVGRSLVPATAGSEITILKTWSYRITHTGRTVADAADTNAVAIGLVGNLPAGDYAIAPNKIVIGAGDSVVIPPYSGTMPEGKTTVIVLRAKGGAPVLTVVREQEFGGSFVKSR